MRKATHGCVANSLFCGPSACRPRPVLEIIMRRKCIRLNPIEHSTLARLYEDRRIATDRYMHRPKDLRDLTNTFNGLTDRHDSPEDILHYMQTQRRRAGQW